MSSSPENLEYEQPDNFVRKMGRFAIGASAGLLAGSIGASIVYELVTEVLHQPLDALVIIGGPAIGNGFMGGIRAVRRND